MRKLLNTLYITSEDAYLSLKGETVCVEIGEKMAGRIPLHTLESIVSFSRRGASPALLGECAEKGINMSLFSPYGKYLCRVVGVDQGNVLLRKQQYRISDDEHKSCCIAKNFIFGKVYNSRWNINRSVRDHEMRLNVERCRDAESKLTEALHVIRIQEDLDRLRGIEGECASIYFGVFDELILNQKDTFFFRERNKRPPLDNVNSMLSFMYTILANDCAAALEGVGLDSYVGFMHRDRPGRRSLALDLMEELRSILADRFVLTLINNKQMKDADFVKTDSNAVEFTDEGRKKILSAWQEHKKVEITHPYLKERVPWGLVPHVQALLLARYLRDDLDEYPPFLWK